MNILFTANEVGSVRAIYPIMQLCNETNIKFSYTKIGFFGSIDCNAWNVFPLHGSKGCSGIKEQLIKKEITVVIFSVNMVDTLPLKIAREANNLGIPTIHVIDSWNGYLSRMKMDHKCVFFPNYYVVPDEFAKVDAIREGIPSDIIMICGQPAFEDSLKNYKLNMLDSKKNLLISNGLTLSGKLILFVSEPVRMDFGASIEDNKYYKGYTEFDVIPMVKNELSKYSNIETCVLPHPRESEEQLSKLWSEDDNYKHFKIISSIRGRKLLPFVDGVVGMASTLLYEAWLMNIPVLSIQPGLIEDNLKMLKMRDGVTFIDKKNNSDKIINTWLKEVSLNSEDSFRLNIIKNRCSKHMNSSISILNLAR